MSLSWQHKDTTRREKDKRKTENKQHEVTKQDLSAIETRTMFDCRVVWMGNARKWVHAVVVYQKWLQNSRFSYLSSTIVQLSWPGFLTHSTGAFGRTVKPHALYQLRRNGKAKKVTEISAALAEEQLRASKGSTKPS